MNQSIEEQILSRVYGRGRGWAFSQKDFVSLGTRSAIDKAFERLLEKGTIRRVIRGIYDYPKYSTLLKQELSPDLDQIAAALARKFGWRIQVTGASALNLLGISTQVVGRVVYVSDGPDKVFIIGKQTLEFKNSVLKEAALKLRESALIVQGLKSLGQEQITPEVIDAMKKWLPEHLKKQVLKDTQVVTGWIYAAIVKICQETPS